MVTTKVTYFRKTTDHLEQSKKFHNFVAFFTGLQVLKDDYKINVITYFNAVFLLVMYGVECYAIYDYSSNTEKMLQTMANVGFIFQVREHGFNNFALSFKLYYY